MSTTSSKTPGNVSLGVSTSPSFTSAQRTDPPPPAPAQPIISVPAHGWTLHVGPTGHLYAWNHLTQRATWKLPLIKPDPPFVAFPPPVPRYRVTVPPAEKVVAKHRLGDTHVWACDTDAGNRFFFHRKTKRSTWRATPDLVKWITELDERLQREKVVAGETQQKEEDAMNVDRAGEQVLEDEMDDLEAELMMLEAQTVQTDTTLVPDHALGDHMDQFDDDDFDDDDEEIHEFTFAEKSALFLSHLRSLDVSPFAPFDPTILPDIDLTSRQRQELFDQYCHERAAELKAAKLAAMDPRQQFLQLVYENRKLFWEEMKRKFKKDPRFYGYGSTDREREKLWKEAKKMKPDELKRAIESAGVVTAAASSESSMSVMHAQEGKRVAAEEALRAREAQVRADLASARQHATKVLRKANADEARALFSSLLVDYARPGDDPAGLLAAVRRDARFQQVVQLGLGMTGMQEMIGTRLAELRAAAERMIAERLAREVTMARVGSESVASVVEKSSWGQDSALVKSVGGIEKLEAIVGGYLADKRAEARKMAMDALSDARASIEAWVADRLAEGVEPETEVHGLAHLLRSDPRWAGVDGMQEDSEELMRGAIKSAMASIKGD